MFCHLQTPYSTSHPTHTTLLTPTYLLTVSLLYLTYTTKRSFVMYTLSSHPLNLSLPTQMLLPPTQLLILPTQTLLPPTRLLIPPTQTLLPPTHLLPTCPKCTRVRSFCVLLPFSPAHLSRGCPSLTAGGGGGGRSHAVIRVCSPHHYLISVEKRHLCLVLLVLEYSHDDLEHRSESSAA